MSEVQSGGSSQQHCIEHGKTTELASGNCRETTVAREQFVAFKKWPDKVASPQAIVPEQLASCLLGNDEKAMYNLACL